MSNPSPLEPFTAFGVTVRPEPLMPAGWIHRGRWKLNVIGSVESPRYEAYLFVAQARPCNPDGSEPCNDKRSGLKIIQIEVARLHFQDFGFGSQRDIYQDLLRIAERRLEESPECCIKHLLMGQWDGSACILSAPREEPDGNPA